MSESGGKLYASESSEIFVLGSVENQQIVLKIKASELVSLELDRFEFLSSASSNAALWSPSISSAKLPRSLFDHMTTEATFFRRGDNWYILSLHMLDRYFQLCQTTELGLNWTCRNIAEVERRWQTPQLISYAGKAHPGLLGASCSSHDDELRIVVSFVTNTIRDMGLLFTPEYRETYTPKFMVVSA